MSSGATGKVKPTYNMLKVYGESHLIAAAIPSLILPVAAFIGSCIQVRYLEEYETCLAEVQLTNVDYDDGLLGGLRTMTALFFAYSLSYFFLLTGHHNYSDRFH